MKKELAIAIIIAMFLILPTAVSALGNINAYQNGEPVLNWAEIIEHETISINVGDLDSEAQVTMSGWSKVYSPTGSGWGGFVGDLRTIYGPSIIPEDKYTYKATITLDESYPIENIYIHHLDGTADDSFNLYIDDDQIPIFHYTDHHSSEVWEDSYIPVNSYGQTLTFEITGPLGSGAATYGQVCIDIVEITGYDTEDPYGQGELVRIVWE